MSKSEVSLPDCERHSKADLCLVDDDRCLSAVLRDLLAAKGHTCDLYFSPEAALSGFLDRSYQLAIVDYLMPGMDGLCLIDKLKSLSPNLKTLLLTGISDAAEVEERSRKKGVDFFLRKPPDPVMLDAILSDIFSGKHARLKEEKKKPTPPHLIVGESPAVRETLRLIERLAPTEANLMILGETGTGKELAARTLHAQSLRKEGPFIPINCASLPDNLLESELFGHEKGAFTGAHQFKKGLFEWADSGTLFLDEIGDMNYGLQAKLLRVIQERKIRRVGGSAEIPVDVRIISATNKTLDKMVVEGTFREDLYFRLNVVKVKMPSLRERREDIPLLVRHFITKLRSKDPSLPEKRMEGATLKVLSAYVWPGNVRELENVVSELLIMSTGKNITPDLLPDRFHASASLSDNEGLLSLEDCLGQAKRDYLHFLLQKHQGHVSNCAKEAKVNRASFHRMLQSLKIRSEKYRLNP
ncbi:MAG: hypothetical protein A2293_09685 [Elusimicrobia bacterium RIFOXYB2_FULL_49_7]|nr:MAG: hypothetical protein A2293_09685 [Elusimicrobia bacterium RIFOXYB2_FULL_49_7]